MKNDSVQKTFLVATILCLVGSVLVSTAAVSLKPLQEENKVLDVRKNLLLAAGLINPEDATKDAIKEAFKNVKTIVVDLSTGEVDNDIDVEAYDQKAAAKDSSQNMRIDADKDLAGIKYREKKSKVFLIKDGTKTTQVVIPIYGKGLWSTMYGFMSLSTDTNVIKGFGFYEHGETPGLGAEIDNKKWKASWIGKIVFDENHKPIIDIIKGTVNRSLPAAKSQIDGIAGATLTANGVENLVVYWLGEDGFGPFLEKFRQGSVQ